MQNLRQAANAANVKSAANTASTVNTTNTSPSSAETNNNATSPRRGGIKIRSPRPVVTVSAPIITQNPIQTASVISTVTPAALVVAKPMEAPHTLTLSKSTNIQPILSAVRTRDLF